MRRFLQVIFVAIVAVLLLGAGGDSGQRFDYLGHQLMCRCGCNQVLLECNHVGCTYSAKMREELSAAIKRGDSNKTILASFVQEYGPPVLAAPTTQGFDLVAWIMPFVALAMGTVLAAWVARLWRRRQKPLPARPALVSNRADSLRQRAREETEL